MRDWIVHFFEASRWSASGVYILFLEEQAARMELFGAVAGLVWLLIVRCSVLEVGVYIALCLASLAVEALNTAIEGVVDHLSPNRTDFGRRAKDLGSAAVFFMLSATAVYWVALNISHFSH
jgi:diacylglycerol kinase (ATP)